jgi:hypothetical protein
MRARGRCGVKITETVWATEAKIAKWLTTGQGWAVWRDERTVRRRHVPSFLAAHFATGRIVAVYCRPRRLHPSELPEVTWLPAGVIPVVWHLAMHPEVRSWLLFPDIGPIPGLVPARGDTR